MAQRLTYLAIGVIFAAGVAYNVWTWRTPSASSSNSSVSAAAVAAAPNPESALAPPVAAPPPLTTTSLRLPVESGSLDIELAAKVSEQHEPQPAAVEFDESVPDIFVAIKSNLPEGVTVGVTFRRLPNESVPARDLETTTVRVPPDQRGSGKVHAPREGFLPGNYELVASINNINPQTLPFRVTSRYADARKVVAAEGIPALNVAVAAVVGFALTDQLAQQQLAEAAALTGGSYLNARDDAALKDAIDAAIRVPFEIRDSSGAVIASGQVGQDALQVPEGQYTIVVQAAQPLTIPNVRAIADRESKVELKREGREIGVKVIQP